MSKDSGALENKLVAVQNLVDVFGAGDFLRSTAKVNEMASCCMTECCLQTLLTAVQWKVSWPMMQAACSGAAAGGGLGAPDDEDEVPYYCSGGSGMGGGSRFGGCALRCSLLLQEFGMLRQPHCPLAWGFPVKTMQRVRRVRRMPNPKLKCQPWGCQVWRRVPAPSGRRGRWRCHCA